MGGGIGNTGVISAGNFGIEVGGSRSGTFAGGISNGGTISAGNCGIFLTNVVVFGNSSTGGVINNGSISAGTSGLVVASVQTFTGSILNSGTISAAQGADINFQLCPTFLGSIVNNGELAAPLGKGIHVNSVVLFGGGNAGGGISNSGTISAHRSHGHFHGRDQQWRHNHSAVGGRRFA